ncbi:SLBB domain-containing protein [Marinilabiliaceae bacterium ANBcel2]|nr:SLBB domain-containing protein [Marinilabiliaceae bacterium ANBcel2]
MRILLFNLLFFILLCFTPLNAQFGGMDPASVDVSSLSDNQIDHIVSEINSRGLTIDQAIAMARAQGVSDNQIAHLRQRIEQHRGIEGAEDDLEFLEFEEETVYSEKPFFIATEEEKSIFGFHFFNSEELTFSPGRNYAVTSSYIVGASDQFSIDVYGASEMRYVVEVNRNGEINIPNVGPVLVGGFTLKEAEKRIFDKLAGIYRDMKADEPSTFVNINISKVKPVTVNVVGEVFAPGTYVLPGTATAFNALYLSGGPNLKGSFRDIKVMRDNKVAHVVDVYDFLINGSGDVNIQLRDGDVIIVPAYKKRVRLGGNFVRTGIFESKEGESIEELINYAGGFDEKAYRNRVEVYRNTGRELEVKDVFEGMFDQFFMQSGDSIYAGEVLDRFANRVVIEGAVFRPGTYELSSGMMLSELIDKADGLREDAFMERGMILRLNDDLTYSNLSFNVHEIAAGSYDVQLKREDVVTISPIDSLREERHVNVYGEVLSPGRFKFRDNLTLGDVIKLSGGFKESASESYVEVTRRLSYQEAAVAGEKTGHLYQFTVPRSLALEGDDAEFKIEPYDRIFVRRAPGFAEEGRVTLKGEVNYAGEYALVERNEKLSDLINRGGGLKPDAYPEGAMLTRPVSESVRERRIKEASVGQERGVELSELGFEVVGVDLKKALANPGSRHDLYLQPGDELVVPKQMQTVKIDGGVLNPVSVPYVEGRGLKYYVDQGGGFGLRARKNRAYVVYPNGSAAATSNFLLFRSYPDIEPGSTIIIPEKPQRDPIPPTGWIAIASGVSSLALTIVTVINQL